MATCLFIIFSIKGGGVGQSLKKENSFIFFWNSSRIEDTFKFKIIYCLHVQNITCIHKYQKYSYGGRILSMRAQINGVTQT